MSLLQDSMDSIGETYRDLDQQIGKRRKAFEKRTRRELNGLRKKLPKRAQHLQRDGARWIEKSMNDVLGFFQLASKSDLSRIDRRLAEISRKLGELGTPKKSRSLSKFARIDLAAQSTPQGGATELTRHARAWDSVWPVI